MARNSTGARERIIDGTTVLLRQGGYSAAGVNEVVAVSKAPKGSVYHYFPAGKEQFVSESLVNYEIAISTLIRSTLSDTSSLEKRVKKFFNRISQRMALSSFTQSCAVGATILSLPSGSELLQKQCSETLDVWANVAAECLVEVPKAKRACAARVLISLLEGAQISARASQSDRPLKEAAVCFLAFVKTLLPPN
jgi:TetR/AcrR family transcriptional regulator, lmrAB and yxaGH operons repressor